MGIHVPRARTLVAPVVIAVVAAGCAVEGARPTLSDSRGAADTAAAMEALVAAEALEPLPTTVAPELFGVDDRPEPPPILAFGIDTVDGPSVSIETGVAPDSEPTESVSEDPPSSTEVDGGLGETNEADESDESEGGEGDGDDPDPLEPIGPVPVAPAGIDPRYEDPSPTIITSSGRPFELPADQGAVQGVTDDTIVIGGLVTESLAGFFHREHVCVGAAARFAQANEHDELSRAIEFQGCYDDVGDLGIARGLTHALVRDGVFAVVPLASETWFEEQVLTEAQVPYVGGDRLPGFCGRATPFGFGMHGAPGCPVLDARGFVTLTQPVVSAWLAAHDDSPPGEVPVHLVPMGPDGEIIAASRIFESDLLGRERPVVLHRLPGAADGVRANWVAIAEEVVGVGPDVVFIEGPVVVGLPQALRDAGFDGEIVVVGTIDPTTVASPADRVDLGPVTVVSPGVDVANRTSPGWIGMVGSAAAFGLEEADVDLDFIEGYLAADFIVQAIAATPEPLTGAALSRTVNSGWWYPGVEGLACGSWWPASHFIETPCVSVSRVEPFGVTPVLGLVDTVPQLRFNLGD